MPFNAGDQVFLFVIAVIAIGTVIAMIMAIQGKIPWK